HLLHVVGLAEARGEDVLGWVHLYPRIRREVPIRRRERSVAGPVAQPQEPGFGLVARLAANEIDCPVGVVVGSVAFDEDRLGAVEAGELLLVVVGGIVGMGGPVPHGLVVPVAAEACVGAGVPFADLAGEVAQAAKLGRPEPAQRWVVAARWI